MLRISITIKNKKVQALSTFLILKVNNMKKKCVYYKGLALWQLVSKKLAYFCPRKLLDASSLKLTI